MATVTETITETLPCGASTSNASMDSNRTRRSATSAEVRKLKQFVQKQRVCFDPIDDADEYLYTGAHKLPRCSDSNLRALQTKVKKDWIFRGEAKQYEEQLIDGFTIVGYETEQELHKAMIKAQMVYIDSILQEREDEKKGVKRVLEDCNSVTLGSGTSLNAGAKRVRRGEESRVGARAATPVKLELDTDSNDDCSNLPAALSQPGPSTASDFIIAPPVPATRVITSRKRVFGGKFRRFGRRGPKGAEAGPASAEKIANMLQRTSRSGRTIKPSKAVLNSDYLDEEYIDALEKGQFDFYKYTAINGPMRRPRGFNKMLQASLEAAATTSSATTTTATAVKDEPISPNSLIVEQPSTSTASVPSAAAAVARVVTKIHMPSVAAARRARAMPKKPSQVSLLKKTKTGAYTYKARSTPPLVRVHNHLMQSSASYRPSEDGLSAYPTAGAVEVVLYSKKTTDGVKTFLRIPGRPPYEINQQPYPHPKRMLLNADAINSLPPPAVTPAVAQYKRASLTDGHGLTDTDRTYIGEVLNKLEEDPEVRFFKRFDSLVPGLVRMRTFANETVMNAEVEKFIRMMYKLYEKNRNKLTELNEEKEKLKDRLIKPASENGLKEMLEKEQEKNIRKPHVIHTLPMVSKQSASGLNVYRPINAGTLPSNAQFMVVKTSGTGQATEAKGVNGNIFRLLAGGQTQPTRTIKLMVSQAQGKTITTATSTVTTMPVATTMTSTPASQSIIKGTGQIKISPGSPQVIKMGPVRTGDAAGSSLPDGVKLVQLSPVIGTRMGAPNHSGQYLRTILPNVRSQSGTIKVISTLPGSSTTVVTQSKVIPAAEVKANSSSRKREESLLRPVDASIPPKKEPTVTIVARKSETPLGRESLVLPNGGDDCVSRPALPNGESQQVEDARKTPDGEESKTPTAVDKEEVVVICNNNNNNSNGEDKDAKGDDHDDDDEDVVLVSELRAPTMKRLDCFQKPSTPQQTPVA